MKVVTAELSQAKGWDELGVLEVLRARNPQSPGYLHIPHIRDHFTHVGHRGTHTCLIMEAMGPSAIDIHSSFHETYGRVLGLPLFLVKRMCKDVLLALQYAHECELVHTGMTMNPPWEQLSTQCKRYFRHQRRQYSHDGNAGHERRGNPIECGRFTEYGLQIDRLWCR